MFTPRLRGLSIKRSAYYIPFLLLLLLSSCMVSTIEEKDDEWINPPVLDGDSIKAMFSIQTPGVPTSYALADLDENFIEEVDLLIFREEAGKFYFAYRAEGTITADNNDTKVFTAILRKDLVNNYQFVILANSRSQLNSLGGLATSGVKELVLPRIISHVSGKWNATSSADFTLLPMWGEVSTPTTVSADMTIPSLKLVRSVARVDMVNTLATTTFDLKEVYVYNWKNRGRIVPETSSAYWNMTDYRALKASIPAVSDPLNEETPLQYTVTNNKSEREIYIHEADSLADGKDLEATCLIVGGKYNGADRVSYYRVDFRNADRTFKHILRNHLYRFKISSVSEEGYHTADSAFRYKEANMHVDITTWNMADMKEVVIDGTFQLTVSTGRIDFTNTVTSYRLYVTSDNPKGWSVTDITGSGFTAVKTASGNAVDVTASASSIDGSFNITSGNLKKKIIVRR